MSIVRITRFTVDPADAGQLFARRAALISAVGAAYSGLIETRLGRIDKQTWVDIWRWNSAAELDAAQAGVARGAVSEAGPAFALATSITAEQAEIVDQW